ncbi:hypothetical protein JRQ81_017662 [Phrynocephalus forsythii]|uniref:3CxxC-type domain-containing protein n=1 Tax=Phrynocephalus forsythii TaxID=171643 RepID=A0A9Q1B0J3_9SAUR|nr:hypothetical protein JRQ81_017662 [Phrynocephalus forsythii]
MILFHLHWEPSVRQGRVKMRVFDQQCCQCDSSKYEEPQFTEETILNVLAQLVSTIRKKCYRERVEDCDLHEVVCQSGGGPHKEDYCEACQLGIHKGHSETPQGGVYHEKTSPWKPQDTRQHKWPPVTVQREITHPRQFQPRMLSGAIGERAASPESPLTSFPQCRGNVKCCIPCVVVTVVIIAVIGFLKKWW